MALSGSLVSLGLIAGIYGLLVIGLNIKFGYNGLLDIGHVAFFLIGAYGSALLVLPPSTVPQQAFAEYILGLGWTWPPAIIVAMLAAGVFGMLVALPAIRLREDYLAIAVLGISVIVKRIIQTETWLANGPTSLKGWDNPMASLFAMPGSANSFDVVLLGIGIFDVTVFSVPVEIVFGTLVAGVWIICIYSVAVTLEPRTTDNKGSRVAHAITAIATLGFGYVAARGVGFESTDNDWQPAVYGGVVAGLIGTGMAFIGNGLAMGIPGIAILGMFRLALFLFMGFASLTIWIVGAFLVLSHYEAVPRRDVYVGIGMAVGVVVTFAPLILLGGGSADRILGLLVTGIVGVIVIGGIYTAGELDVRSTGIGVGIGLGAGIAFVPLTLMGGSIGTVLTIVLAIFLSAGIRYLSMNWSEIGGEGSLFEVIGFGTGVGLLTVFVPMIITGSGSEYLSSVGVGVTLVLGTILLGAMYYLGLNWEQYGIGDSIVPVFGIATVTVFVLRYFFLSSVEPFKTDGVTGMIDNLIENVFWLVNFSGSGLVLDYARFLLLVILFALGITYLIAERTVKSPFGRVLKAIREDEDVATALGKNVFRYKVQSMIVGSAIAGLAGALAAIFFGALIHNQFAPRITFVVLLMVVIGGAANNRGVLLGAVIFWAFRNVTTTLTDFFPTAVRTRIQALRLVFIGALFIIILYYRPQGIWGEQRIKMENIK